MKKSKVIILLITGVLFFFFLMAHGKGKVHAQTYTMWADYAFNGNSCTSGWGWNSGGSKFDYNCTGSTLQLYQVSRLPLGMSRQSGLLWRNLAFPTSGDMVIEARFRYNNLSTAGYGNDAVGLMWYSPYNGERVCYNIANGFHSSPGGTPCAWADPFKDILTTHGNQINQSITIHPDPATFIGWTTNTAQRWFIARWEHNATSQLWTLNIFDTSDTPNDPSQPYNDLPPTAVYTVNSSLRPFAARIGHFVYFDGSTPSDRDGNWADAEVDYIRVWTTQPTTPTLTPWAAAHIRNPQGTPVVVDRVCSRAAFRVDGSASSSSSCSIAADTLAERQAENPTYERYGFLLNDLTSLNLQVIGVTPIAGGMPNQVQISNAGGRHRTFLGWPIWHSDGREAVVVVATPTNTPAQTPTPTNTPTPSITPTPGADLRILKTDSVDPVMAGDTFRYTLIAQNLGPSMAHNVTVSDRLPDGLDYQSLTSSPQWTCNYAPLTRTVTCTTPQLAFGAFATVASIYVNVQTTYPFPTILNTATIASTSPVDPNLTNNADSEITAIISPSADVSITKSDDIDPIEAGEVLVYTLNVTNAGPSVAQNAIVRDVMPVNVTYVNASAPAGWSCAYHTLTRTLTCTTPSLPIGGTASIRVDVVVALEAESPVINTAAVSATTFDPDLTNNRDSEETIIQEVWGITPPTGEIFTHVKVNEKTGVMMDSEWANENDYLSNEIIAYPIQVPIGVGLGFHIYTYPQLCIASPCTAPGNVIQGYILVESYSFTRIENLDTGAAWDISPGGETPISLYRYADPDLPCDLGQCIARGLFQAENYHWENPSEYMYLYWQHPNGEPLECPPGEYQCWNITNAVPGFYKVSGEVTIRVEFPGFPDVTRRYRLPGTATFQIVSSFAQPLPGDH